MAQFSKYFPHLIKIEGGYVNDKDDRGGATKYGITLATWKKLGYDKNGDGLINEKDVKLISVDDAAQIAKRQYWDFFWADQIQNQSVAEFIVDFGYHSGVVTVALIVQKLISVKADGVFGPMTLAAINKMSPQLLFEALKIRRKEYLQAIIDKRPSQKKYKNGWFKRVDSFEFKH